MTPKAQKIAIAEFCGWKRRKQTGLFGMSWDMWDKNGASNQEWQLPRYLSDLNAMHEAERKLSLVQRDSYWRHLQRITEKGRMATAAWTTTTASAAHRAEALLRTLKLWED